MSSPNSSILLLIVWLVCMAIATIINIIHFGQIKGQIRGNIKIPAQRIWWYSFRAGLVFTIGALVWPMVYVTFLDPFGFIPTLKILAVIVLISLLVTVTFALRFYYKIYLQNLKK